MCMPKQQLFQLALIGATAYATGGASAFTSGSTLANLGNMARVAAPFIGAAGQLYTGYLQSQQLHQKANFVNYQAVTEKEAYALRKVKRLRALRIKIGEQRALFSSAGITLSGTPQDIMSYTAGNFAEDQFIDTFNTSQNILSKQFSAENLKHEAKISLLGGMTNAAITLGTRGVPPSSTPAEYSTTRPSGLI